MLRISANMWWQDHFQRLCGSMRLPAFLSGRAYRWSSIVWWFSLNSEQPRVWFIEAGHQNDFCYANRYVWIKPVSGDVKCDWASAWDGTTFNMWSHESTSSTKDVFICSASIFCYFSLAIPQVKTTLILCNCLCLLTHSKLVQLGKKFRGDSCRIKGSQ